MSRLEELRALRKRIDREITREIDSQRRIRVIEAETESVERSHDETTKALIEAAADYYGVSARVLLSDRRTKKATTARMVAIWAIRTSLGTSYPELGRRFGRDHSTAINAVKKVDASAAMRAAGARLLRGLEEAA